MSQYGDTITCALYDNEDISHLVKVDGMHQIQVLYFIKEDYSINIDIYDDDFPSEYKIYLNQAAWYTELYNILNCPSVRTDLNIEDLI
jgi:hypothetical protein